jgi:antitoxin component of RelBE/YafQ-DinJ toxin-antitoxin module
MVTIELDITQEEKERAEQFAKELGLSLSEFLSRITMAGLPRPIVVKKKKASILQALKELPPLTGSRPMTTAEDKEWLIDGLREKNAGNQ